MDAILKASLPKLREKLLEALQAVLPIAAIVLVLCFTIAPVSPSILLCFLLGAAMIVVGIMFFTLGAEMSMTPMGERVGAVITKSRKLPVILGIGFLLGFLRGVAGLVLALVLYCLFYLAIAALHKIRRQERPPESYPFAPFLAAGFFTAYII